MRSRSAAEQSAAQGSAAQRSAAERGSVAAEFAVAMPAVVLVLATALGGVQLAGLQLKLQDAVADAARSLARGESSSQVAALARRQVPDAALAMSAHDGLVCAELSATPTGVLGITGLRVAAASCALAGGL